MGVDLKEDGKGVKISDIGYFMLLFLATPLNTWAFSAVARDQLHALALVAKSFNH